MNVFFNFANLNKNLTDEQLLAVMLLSLLFVAVIYLGMFVLKAVAVCRMARKRGFSNWWLGMIPYANYYMIGKLAGPVRIFRMDIKNIGLFVLVSAAILDVARILNVLQIFSIVPIGTYLFYTVYQLSYLVELVFYISSITLYFAIFGKYAPSKRLLFTLLSIIQIMFPILLIAIMNNKPYSSFDDYYKEQMAKRYGQTYNPYENPYSTNENPYNNSNSNSNSNNGQQFEDPFDEFKGD